VGSPPFFVRGDCNGDGAVNLADAICLFGYLYLGDNTGEACRKAMDMDDNGKLEITDPISLLGWLFLGGDPPPYPSVTGSSDPVSPRRCGPDPTPDDGLDCGRTCP